MKKIQKTSTKSDNFIFQIKYCTSERVTTYEKCALPFIIYRTLSLMNHLNTNHACQLSIVACIHPNVNLIDQVCFETLKALQPQHVMFACTHYR